MSLDAFSSPNLPDTDTKYIEMYASTNTLNSPTTPSKHFFQIHIPIYIPPMSKEEYTNKTNTSPRNCQLISFSFITLHAPNNHTKLAHSLTLPQNRQTSRQQQQQTTTLHFSSNTSVVALKRAVLSSPPFPTNPPAPPPPPSSGCERADRGQPWRGKPQTD